MKKTITSKNLDQIEWTDLGNHAYHHWLHERGFSKEFHLLCDRSADVLLETLSEEEKNMILKDKISKDLRDQYHYGEVATQLISMGHQDIVDEVGLKPSSFTGSQRNSDSWEIDFETGEYEPPVLKINVTSEINNKKVEK